MNPVLILSRNNLDLTKRCVESVRAQDIETDVHIFDNGSSDGTVKWGESAALDWTTEHRETLKSFWSSDKNYGVSYGWNVILANVFNRGAGHALVINNDVVLPHWFYSELLSYNEPFVTGVAVDDMDAISYKAPRCTLNPHPDFSAFLIRREVWEKVGPFDQRMKIYVQDCDFHIRAHRMGINLWKANVPYYHINSQTMRRADPAEQAAIQAQANADREVFKSIYGCLPGTPEYENLFK